MRKTTKIWLVTATFLVIVGLIMFVAVMSKYRWDFSKLSTAEFVTNTYDISEEFNSLSVKTDTADITFVLSDDKKCKVKCYEEEKSKHSVTVKDGTLVIDVINNKSWYDYIGINFDSPKITVYLPSAEYASLLITESTGDIKIPKNFKFGSVDISSSTGDVDFFASAVKSVKIKSSTGNICVENSFARAFELSASTGKITVSDVICEGTVKTKISTGKTVLTDIECKNLVSGGNTGDLFLKNVVATEKVSIERDTGDVTIDGLDAAKIFIETDTGNVTGALLSEKVFIAHSDTGKVDVPRTTTGGICEINTDTGNIKLEIK